VLGICGGFQMLGSRLVDEEGVESAPGTSVDGLGLLDVETRFEAAKQTRRVVGRITASDGPWGRASGCEVSGYEIHMGCSEGEATPLLSLGGRPDGAISSDGRIAGCYLHGLFHNDGLRASVLGWFGRDAEVSTTRATDAREAAFDRVASVVQQHLDLDRVRALLEEVRT
jgi:adenosylcobyric acid synthase